VNNELYQSQEAADVVAIPHSDDLLKKNCTFVSLFIHLSKIEDAFLARRGVTDPERSDLR
jgi:hypothetical protein